MKILHENVQPLAQLPFKYYKHNFNENLVVDPHWHQGIEINYLVQGDTLNFVTAGKTMKYHSGDIWTVNHRDIHSVNTTKKAPFLEFGLIIDDNFLQQQVPASKDWHLILNSINSTHDHYQSYQRIKTHLTNIQLLLEKPLTDLTRLNILSHFYGLLNELGENFNHPESNNHVNPNLSLLDTVMSNINKNYAKEIDGNTLATEFHTSLTTLNQQFNTNVQMSVNRYLRLIRLLNSRKLLLESDRSIDYIANSCGFSSGKTFNRNFKAWKGQTPSDYRSSFSKYHKIDTNCL